MTDISEQQLIETVNEARKARRDAEGRACTELHERGWTWERIGAELGVSQSTAHRWSTEYVKKNPPPA